MAQNGASGIGSGRFALHAVASMRPERGAGHFTYSPLIFSAYRPSAAPPQASSASWSVHHHQPVTQRKSAPPIEGVSTDGSSLPPVETKFVPASVTTNAKRQAASFVFHCEDCGVTETSQARRGPSGPRTLCNRCDPAVMPSTCALHTYHIDMLQTLCTIDARASTLRTLTIFKVRYPLPARGAFPGKCPTTHVDRRPCRALSRFPPRAVG